MSVNCFFFFCSGHVHEFVFGTSTFAGYFVFKITSKVTLLPPQPVDVVLCNKLVLDLFFSSFT